MIWIAATIALIACLAFFLARRASGPHALARRGHVDGLEALVARHPELVNERDAAGETPLHSAAKYDQFGALAVLVDAGGNLDHRAEGGPTPLVLAAAFNCQNTTKLLIERGADLDVPDDNGVTALHFATRLGHLEVARALIRAGARVNMKAGGETVLDVAVASNQTELAEEIRSSGGRTGKEVRMRDVLPPKSIGKHVTPAVLAMPPEDTRLVEAAKEAQQSLDVFKRLYAGQLNRSAVKFDGGHNEFVWGRVTELRGDGVTVCVVSDPLTFAGPGEARFVAWEKVTDWLVEAADAKVTGGYSLRAMCPFVREEYGFLDAKYADIERALSSS